MKILITIGTTKFDTLIEYLDTNLDYAKKEVLFQIANGMYEPKNFPFIRFTDQIVEKYIDSDLIITHAGCGSILSLLELNKKIIIVPNMDRLDKHQLDIANFMHENKYAISCLEFNDILTAIKNIELTNFRLYKKNSFNQTHSIVKMINNLYNL